VSGGEAKRLALQLKEDFRGAGLGPEDMALLEYAEKITVAPWSVTEEDVRNLRNHGFSDAQILEVAALASYRNYIARVANALGVELHDHTFADDPEFRGALEVGLR
jgi:alkylhydroperoxidase family enzyme